MLIALIADDAHDHIAGMTTLEGTISQVSLDNQCWAQAWTLKLFTCHAVMHPALMLIGISVTPMTKLTTPPHKCFMTSIIRLLSFVQPEKAMPHVHWSKQA